MYRRNLINTIDNDSEKKKLLPNNNDRKFNFSKYILI